MTDAPVHKLIDFDSLPKTVEQQTLDTLLRIEKLLTPSVITVLSGEELSLANDKKVAMDHKDKIAALQARVPSGRKGSR